MTVLLNALVPVPLPEPVYFYNCTIPVTALYPAVLSTKLAQCTHKPDVPLFWPAMHASGQLLRGRCKIKK